MPQHQPPPPQRRPQWHPQPPQPPPRPPRAKQWHVCSSAFGQDLFFVLGKPEENSNWQTFSESLILFQNSWHTWGSPLHHILISLVIPWARFGVYKVEVYILTHNKWSFFFLKSVFEIWKFGAPSLGIYQSMKITSSWSLQVRDPWNSLDSLHFYFWHIPLSSLRIGEKGGKMKISNALPGIFGCFWKIEAPYIFWETRVVETFPSQNSIARSPFSSFVSNVQRRVWGQTS